MALLRNKNAEEDLIGILLRNPSDVIELADVLIPEDFSDAKCAEIFKAIRALSDECKVISKAAIAQRCGSDGLALIVYMTSLAAAVPQGMAVMEAAEIVEDASIRRRATAVMDRGIKGLGVVDKPEDILEHVHSEVLDLIGRKVDRGNQIGVIASEFYANVGKPDSKKIIIRSGLEFLDGIGPMMSDDMLVLAGTTSAGKTALARQICFEIAQQGIPTLYLTKEMSSVQITLGIWSQITGVSNEKIETDDLNPAERERIMNAGSMFRRMPMRIEDLPKGATVSTALSRVLYNQKKYGVQFVVIDDLHKLKSDDKVRDRFERIESVAMGLKECAKQTRIPWLCLAHINRESTKRDDHRPKREDLFGASEIEKSADVIFFVHREQQWLERNQPAHEAQGRERWESDMRRWKNRAEIIVDKRRRGKGADLRECGFQESATLFYSLNGKKGFAGSDDLAAMTDFL